MEEIDKLGFEIINESGCLNPVIYFDELDKVSDTPKGQEITNLLCHLTQVTYLLVKFYQLL